VAGDDRPFSVTARLRSFRFALVGFAHLVRHEHNARIHLAATSAAIATGLWLQISAADWRWIVAAIALVWICEALNTAIESLCNLISPDHNDHVRIAKDVAAWAVLVSAMAAVVIGVLTLWPYMFGQS
jgi:diacylglycerol kinase (ATP)